LIISSAEELINAMNGPSVDFKKELSDFLAIVAKKVAVIHKKFGLENKPKWSPVEKHLERLTISQMVEFVDKCKEKYMKAAMEPGTAVGALCAQSIGMYQ
jgi:DNA-directed RNA polymerase III subunit RPC1